MKNKSRNEELNEKERSHFEDIEKDVTCKDPGHNIPSHLHIPQGKRYVHICPACGQRSVLQPPQITFQLGEIGIDLINPEKGLKYDFAAAVKKQFDTKVPIKKGCPNAQCFCSGECQKIVGWRDKTPEELRQDRLNRIW